MKWPFAAAAGVSLLVHGAVVWAVLPHAARPPAVQDQPPLEVELIDRRDQQQATAPTPQSAPPPTPPVPQTPRADGVLPPAPPPAPQSPGHQASASRAEVNLGGDDRDEDGLLVTGQNIVPPKADARFRNQPPAYPIDAARRGAQGTVHLVVHVSDTGVPSGVQVAGGSGDASLDRAAVQAVSLWRFNPARNNGVPVPFDYTLDINFRR